MIGNPRTLPRGKPGVSGENGEPPEQPVAPENEDILSLLVNEPHMALQSGQVLFTEGDPPSCMYVVKSGALRIRSGGVIYEDVGPGGIVGEMALVERYPARSATVLCAERLRAGGGRRGAVLVAGLRGALCAPGHADPVAPPARDGSPLPPRAPDRQGTARTLICIGGAYAAHSEDIA